MKTYLLFAGKSYCSNGGMDCFIGDADSIDELKELFLKSKLDWGEIVRHCDMVTVSYGQFFLHSGIDRTVGVEGKSVLIDKDMAVWVNCNIPPGKQSDNE